MRLSWRRLAAALRVTRGSEEAEPERARRGRLLLMLRQTQLLAVCAVLAVIAVVCGVIYFTSRPTTLRIAVGPLGSEDARFVQALAQQFLLERANLRLAVVPTDGPSAAAKELDNRGADLAVVRRDIAYPELALAVAVLRENLVTILVPAEGSLASGKVVKPAKKAESGKSAKVEKPSKGKKAEKTGKAAKADKDEKDDAEDASEHPGGIESLQDLAGKRIGLLGQAPNDISVLNIILREAQVAPEKNIIVPLDPRDVAGSLRGNPVDAIFAFGPVASPYIGAAITAASNGKTLPAFLKIDSSEAIAAREPVYETAELKTGVFGGQKAVPEEDIETISFKHYLVARRTLSEDTVAELTRLVFTARPSLSGTFHTVKVEKPDTDRDALVQAHPGARAYLENEQKTFFDKYSDFIYLGAMLMSGLGSGAAWLASYFRADNRIRRVRLMERALTVVKAARAAESREELERLRAEADDILNWTIREAERNDLDDTALMAFSLALDQAERAISERHAALSGPGLPNATAPPLAGAAANRPASQDSAAVAHVEVGT